MQFGKIFDIAFAIVVVAGVTVAVVHPGTSSVISAIGNAFSSSLRAAMGG